MTDTENKTIDLTDTTVKLVASIENKRAQLFETLIMLRPVYTLTGHVNTDTDLEAYYNVFFNFDGHQKNEDLILKMTSLQDKSNVTIFDFSNPILLSDEKTSPVASVSLILASHVTCPNAEIQELIYEHTGRLATIVEWPLLKDDFSRPMLLKANKKEDVSILWYGLNSEIFTIKPFIQSTDTKINTYVEGKEGRNWKLWQKHLNLADIVFLPKTFTPEDEEVRVSKVEECIRKGKFVVAPNLDSTSIVIDCDLNEGVNLIVNNTNKALKIIKENQKALQRLYDPEISADQLMQAFRIAPNDEFAMNLDFSIENAMMLHEGN